MPVAVATHATARGCEAEGPPAARGGAATADPAIAGAGAPAGTNASLLAELLERAGYTAAELAAAADAARAAGLACERSYDALTTPAIHPEPTP